MSQKKNDESGSNSKGDKAAPNVVDGDFGALGFRDAGMDDAIKRGEASVETVVVDINRRALDVENERKRLRETVPDIVQRARAMAKSVPPDFREVKSVQTGGGVVVTQPLNSDTNIMDAFECLFGSGESRPHFDTFKGLPVGWDGSVLDDDFDLKPVVDALVAFRIPTPSYDKVEKILRRFARRVRINSLIKRMEVMVPAWDEVPRVEGMLIKLFECFDTPLTRDFSTYFWLSIYNRAMTPGCNAPMVLAMFGRQGTGKSYIGKLICEEMLGDTGSDAVPLDWNEDFNIFLRKMTGKSVIANVAEMAGFTRAELTKIKALTTRTMDIMNYKFERDNQQLRQWIMIMDGNEYKGLQRDETGNRRFYPIFVGQLPYNAAREVQWRMDEEWQVDYSTFRGDFWQMMAECSVWMEKHGMSGYQNLVRDLEKRVMKFSVEEMENDRGTIRDDELDMHIIRAIGDCNVHVLLPHVFRDEDGAKVQGRPSLRVGAFIYASELVTALGNIAGRGMRAIPSHIKTKMAALGFKYESAYRQKVYFMHGITDVDAWNNALGINAVEENDMRKSKFMIQGRKVDEGF